MCFYKLWTGEGNDFSYVYSYSKMIPTAGRRFPYLADYEASNEHILSEKIVHILLPKTRTRTKRSYETTDCIVLCIFLPLHNVTKSRKQIKGTVSRDFLLLVFLMIQFPPSPSPGCPLLFHPSMHPALTQLT